MNRPSPLSLRALGAVALAATACGAPTPSAPVPAKTGIDLLVVAPHPDDETLTAGGWLAEAVRRGERVAVIVVTNGDFTCERNGYVRQDETLSAMSTIGVAAREVHFLGYPDGWLGELGAAPVTVERRAEDGACIHASTTYGSRRHPDEHTRMTGEPAPYTAGALEEDLAGLLDRLRPRALVVTHPIDAHPDHAATYAFVRRAIEHAGIAPPPIFRAVVHAGPCWPNGRSRTEPCPRVVAAPEGLLPPLPDPLGAYRPRTRIPIDGAEKLRAIARYPSQTGIDYAHDWLAAFARAEEAYYPETLTPDPLDPSHLLRAAPAEATAPHGVASVGGAWRLDPDGTDVRPVVQRAPLRVVFPLVLGGGAATVDVLRSDDGADAYRLRFTSDPPRAALVRVAKGAERVLRSWFLPHDADGPPEATPHTYALLVDPRPDDGDVAELSLVRDGSLVGVAVDARPRVEGTRVAVRVTAPAEVQELRFVAETTSAAAPPEGRR